MKCMWPVVAMTTSSARPTIVTALFIEWERMARQRHNVHRANAWGLPGEPVEHLDDVLRRAGFGVSSNDEALDNYLAQLVTTARTDDLATRIVLQRIMPGLVSIAVRRAPIVSQGLHGAFDLITAAAWVVIRQFPIERRPRRVAANLLMDVEYAAFVRDTRLKANRCEEHVSPDRLLGVEFSRAGHSRTDPVSDAVALELLLHDLAARGLSETDLQMLRAVSQDVNSVEAAAVLGISPRSVRNRREKALTRAQALLDNRNPLDDDHDPQLPC